MSEVVKIADLSSENIDAFKHLHACIFPTYPSKFFKEVLVIEGVCKVAYLNNQPVGVLSARVQEENQGQKRSLYISSLGCKVHARRRGIGSLLLDCAVSYAQTKSLPRISLHVQEGNEASIDFYLAKGFVIAETVPKYYFRLQPSNAYIMVKELL